MYSTIKLLIFSQLLILFLQTNRAYGTPTHSSVIGFDRIVATINEQIITEQDIANDVILLTHLPIESALLQQYRQEQPLNFLLLQKQVKHLAGNIELYQPSEGAIQRRFLEFRSQWQSIAEYNQFLLTTGLNDQRIQGIIATHLLLENYQKINWGIALDSNNPNNQKYLASWIQKNQLSFRIRIITAP